VEGENPNLSFPTSKEFANTVLVPVPKDVGPDNAVFLKYARLALKLGPIPNSVAGPDGTIPAMADDEGLTIVNVDISKVPPPDSTKSLPISCNVK
jgi:hypothetical protein